MPLFDHSDVLRQVLPARLDEYYVMCIRYSGLLDNCLPSNYNDNIRHRFTTHSDESIHRVLESLSRQNLKILINCWPDPSPSSSNFIDNLKSDLKRYNIDPSRVTIIVGSNYGYNMITNLLPNVHCIMPEFHHVIHTGSLCQEELPDIDTRIFNRFSYLNLVTKPHRLMGYLLLKHKNLLSKNHITFNNITYNGAEHNMNQVINDTLSCFPSLDSIVESNFDESDFPIVSESDNGEKDRLKMLGPRSHNHSWKFSVNNVDYDIVSETLMSDMSEYYYTYDFLSEKTFRNIMRARPFFMLGPRYSLRILQEKYGLLSYSSFIDESYDTLPLEQRMISVMDQVEYIQNMTNNDYVKWLTGCRKVALKNRDIMLGHFSKL